MEAIRRAAAIIRTGEGETGEHEVDASSDFYAFAQLQIFGGLVAQLYRNECRRKGRKNKLRSCFHPKRNNGVLSLFENYILMGRTTVWV